MTMYALRLNNMLNSHYENLTFVARADSLESLWSFLQREEVESYKDAENGDARVWHKNYRKGGPLEWFNPPLIPEPPTGLNDWAEHVVVIPDRQEYLETAAREWGDLMDSMENVS